MTNDKPQQALAPDAIQGALELYLKEVQPVDGRVQINISLNELNVLRRLAATPAVGGEREALQKLYNEVAGVWSAFEHELRNGFGHTNYACVQLRIDEAKAVLAQPTSPAPAVGGEAQFLLDRLEEYDPEDEDHVRDFHGHVAPAIARLHHALAAQTAPPLRGRDARLQLALVGVLDYERESAKLRGFSDCTCMGHSRAAENAYEMGECPHQVARVVLASPPEQPAADPVTGRETLPPIPIEWARPHGATFDQMRANVWASGLADKGDTILIWVNEGDFWQACIVCGSKEHVLPPEPELPAARPMGQS